MKRMKRLLTVLTLNIVWGSCWVSSANAGAITMGTWNFVDPGAASFSNNLSWDDPGLDVGLITEWDSQVEQLSAGEVPVAFPFDQSEFLSNLASSNAWMDGLGIWALPDGSMKFGVEDIPSTSWNDHHHRDYMGHPDKQRPPVPTPEPGTLALMLCGGLAALRKVRSLRS